MKKNVLKYSVVFLLTLFCCVNGYTQTQVFYNACEANETSQEGKMLIIGDDITGTTDNGGYTVVITSENYGQTLCWDTQCHTDQPCYGIIGLPFGNGIIIFMFLVIAYGGFVCFRRRSAQSV